MLKCVRCGADTILRRADVPYCLTCVDQTQDHRSIRARLHEALTEATIKAEAARRDFIVVTSETPSDLPHPDGTQRILNVSAALKAAQSDKMTAHKRLSDFIEHGIVPEDLKRSG